ncbi:GNAT family N-acetyltransferase [Micromonospora sp. CPCC 205539]|uniref:GNAT family N-acetyltransferase n=1 Tax=Micromonospora sp. CPCC 205539 TaxID=3122408 RepID=UPI002FF2AFD0
MTTRDMSEVAMIPTADQLAAAWFEATARLCDVSPANRWIAEHGDVRGFVNDTAVASLNAALSMSLDPDLTSLDEMATRVGEAGVPWSIIVRGTASEAVVALAARHGLRHAGEMPLLACAAEDALLWTGGRQRSEIHPVGSAGGDLYTDVLTAGFGAPEGAFGALMGGDVLDAPGVTGYLAEEAGQQVATGLGMSADGLIGVFNIAVAPWARSRGLGRAITARVLVDGFAAGARTAYLHTSAAARPLYESMGFRLVETWTIFTEQE